VFAWQAVFAVVGRSECVRFDVMSSNAAERFHFPRSARELLTAGDYLPAPFMSPNEWNEPIGICTPPVCPERGVPALVRLAGQAKPSPEATGKASQLQPRSSKHGFQVNHLGSTLSPLSLTVCHSNNRASAQTANQIQPHVSCPRPLESCLKPPAHARRFEPVVWVVPRRGAKDSV